jgi:excisionase family DNA binding protein
MADPIAWLTTPEAAERAGVDESTIRRQCINGRLNAVKRAGGWFINPDSLAEWERTRRKEQETTEQR